MGYTQATITELVNAGYKLFVVHDDMTRLNQYKMRRQKGVRFYPRSKMNFVSLQNLVLQVQPELIVVSGWMDYTYLRAARFCIKKKYKVVCAMDAQWTGSSKQMFAYIISQSGFLNKFFSHAWVCSGQSHYEFARKIGFEKNTIIRDFYSADTSIFNKSYKLKMAKKGNGDHFPKIFLFIGRLEKVKGFNLLLEAWETLSNIDHDWRLRIIGNGSLVSTIPEQHNIDYSEFIDPRKLYIEISDSGFLILPSIKEPWGVVVHECVSGGLPIICSNTVGATSSFLINGYNGWKIQNNNLDELVNTMIKVINTNEKELWNMSVQSYNLSLRISPKTSAYNLLSIL